MANFMACYRGRDGHYDDVECANAELGRYLVLNWKEERPLNVSANLVDQVLLV
jgi:hypothetical protein